MFSKCLIWAFLPKGSNLLLLYGELRAEILKALWLQVHFSNSILCQTLPLIFTIQQRLIQWCLVITNLSMTNNIQKISDTGTELLGEEIGQMFSCKIAFYNWPNHLDFNLLLCSVPREGKSINSWILSHVPVSISLNSCLLSHQSWCPTLDYSHFLFLVITTCRIANHNTEDWDLI